MSTCVLKCSAPTTPLSDTFVPCARVLAHSWSISLGMRFQVFCCTLIIWLLELKLGEFPAQCAALPAAQLWFVLSINPRAGGAWAFNCKRLQHVRLFWLVLLGPPQNPFCQVWACSATLCSGRTCRHLGFGRRSPFS